ncbi:unnamed protein product [Leptidea sinapis]|uniref:Protein kinase domain-containing protein n=1 Tax=Leptidea sinapis TaxID=189913 RepID=A0A5E4QBW8_9NEOP|nr:unnamed protein product [Leptidea sinapis]
MVKLAMATAEMSLPDKKPEHESGYYEGSDQEGSMECGCPSPVSSRNSSHSTKKHRHSAHKQKKVLKKLRTEAVNGINGHANKSVEVVEYVAKEKADEVEVVAGPSKRSSSVELIGGTVPPPARDSIDWNLVEASKIKKRSKVNLNGASKVDISHFDLLKVLGTGAVRRRRGQAVRYEGSEEGFHCTEAEDGRAHAHRATAVRACPFLVTLHYAFQTDAKLHLILDYVAGGELFTHLYQREHFNENEVRIYIAEIILALEHSVSSTATLNWRTSSWTRRVTSCSLTSASRRSSAAERAERTASVAPSSTWRRRWSGVAARAMIL